MADVVEWDYREKRLGARLRSNNDKRDGKR